VPARAAWFAGAGLVLGAALLGDLCLGRHPLAISEALRALLAPDDSLAAILVWDLRLPRAVLGALCGASFAVAGVLMQGVTHNPLAAPELTGVTAGTAFAVVASAVWLGLRAGLQPFAGLAGGCAAAALAVAMAWDGSLRPLRLTLAGMAVAALGIAATTTAIVLAGPQADTLFFWLVGGLAGRSWTHVAIVWPWVAVGLVAALLAARTLDVLALGDATSRSLGVMVSRWRLAIVATAIALTAACVAVAGPVAFLGLTVPHFARRVVGHRHAPLLLASALLGATLLVGADLSGRLLGGSKELPVGMLMALIGGPVLLHQIARQRR
jgi:iron complex transport system permease protein